MKGLCDECFFMFYYGAFPIHVALNNKHPECARQVIASVGDIHTHPQGGSNALQLAIITHNLECVKLCLEMGVHVSDHVFRTWCDNGQPLEIGWLLFDYYPKNLCIAQWVYNPTGILIHHLNVRHECLRYCETLLVVHRTQVFPPDVIRTIVKHLWSMRKGDN